MLVRPALVGALLLASGALAAPAYAVDNACLAVDATTARGDTGRPSAPYDLLGIEAARAEVTRSAPASRGPVRVAVLASGVRAIDRGIPVHAAVDQTGVGGDVVDPLGTEVAGLVAGAPRADGQPVGFAPQAEVVDVRVYVSEESDDPRARPSAPTLASGLEWVAREAGRQRIRVAVVPFVVGADRRLRAAVSKVRAAGVVLVAASGDRPDEGAPFSSDFRDPPAPDEDAGPIFFPAGYDGVVAVNATGAGDPGGALASVVRNSRTTVAAPAYDAVSYGLNGDTCLVQPTSTAAAAGEVAGVLALLWQRYPDERPAQVVARLVTTADGTTDDPTPLVGAGVVQPYEALTRLLAPARDGRVERTSVHRGTDARAQAPRPAPDPLAGTREGALWWALVGGGLLAVALVLRPVLARRR